MRVQTLRRGNFAILADKRKTAVAAVLIALAAALVVRAYLEAGDRAEHERVVLTEEFAEVRIMPGGVVVDRASEFKVGQARVGAVFTSAATYEALRAFYDAELARTGWQFKNELSLRGAVVACYGRDDHRAALQYSSDPTAGWNYALDLMGDRVCVRSLGQGNPIAAWSWRSRSWSSSSSFSLGPGPS
ncbi:MAG: hypothetical protein M3P38_12880 [Chloroflexota bacterium]|nr:hypothetical protein [Chloroflexota bacterium]